MAEESQRLDSERVALRDFYLVFRGGLVLIVSVAAISAIVAFALSTFRPIQYVATASVNVIPPVVGTDSLSGLELSVTAGIDEESYRAIALSPDLLTQIGAPFGYDRLQLLKIASLSTRAAPSQVRGHLVVDHLVTMPGEEGKDAAADIANAWSEATVARVATALSSHLAGAVETVTAEIEERRTAYQAASDEWANFLARDERTILRDRLLELMQEPTTSPDAIAELQERLSDLERQSANLEREVSTTSLAYYRVAPTGPALELQRDLVAGSVFVAIPASAPEKAVESSRILLTLAAAVVGGLLATMLVFFRAAIKEE